MALFSVLPLTMAWWMESLRRVGSWSSNPSSSSRRWLGVMTQKGRGVPKDEHRAAEFSEKACLANANRTLT